MNYLTLFNTLAVLLLVIETLFYIETTHKVKSCLYDPDNIWCYYDLHCQYDSSQFNADFK